MFSSFFLKISPRILYPLLLLIIIIVVFGIQFPYLFKPLWPDEALYGWYARELTQSPLQVFSKEIVEFHPPLFASLLALGHFFVPHELAYRFIPLLISIVGIYLIYCIGIKIKDRFTGLFAAINLSFNYLYLGNATRIWIDTTLTVFILLFIYFLIDFNSSFKKQLTISLIGSCIILLKWSGILIIPFLLIYALLCPSPLTLKNKLKTIRIPLFTFLIVTFSLLINNYIMLGHALADVSALEGRYFIRPFWFYMLNLHNIVIVPYLIPFFLYGFFIIVISLLRSQDDGLAQQKMKELVYANTLLVTWFLVFLLGISFTREKDYRYSLLILPSILLIGCIGLSALIDRYSKNQKNKTMSEIFMIIILLATYGALWPHIDKFLNEQKLTFTGFQEAGLWIKKESRPNTLIIASSTREIRYYSNINFAQFGGQIVLLPVNQTAFENMIRHTRKPVIVEIDRWEKPVQPKWLYPISNNSQQYMAGLGLKLVLTIKHEMRLPDGTIQTMPVIWIFKKQNEP